MVSGQVFPKETASRYELRSGRRRSHRQLGDDGPAAAQSPEDRPLAPGSDGFWASEWEKYGKTPGEFPQGFEAFL